MNTQKLPWGGAFSLIIGASLVIGIIILFGLYRDKATNFQEAVTFLSIATSFVGPVMVYFFGSAQIQGQALTIGAQSEKIRQQSALAQQAHDRLDDHMKSNLSGGAMPSTKLTEVQHALEQIARAS